MQPERAARGRTRGPSNTLPTLCFMCILHFAQYSLFRSSRWLQQPYLCARDLHLHPALAPCIRGSPRMRWQLLFQLIHSALRLTLSLHSYGHGVTHSLDSSRCRSPEVVRRCRLLLSICGMLLYHVKVAIQGGQSKAGICYPAACTKGRESGREASRAVLTQSKQPVYHSFKFDTYDDGALRKYRQGNSMMCAGRSRSTREQ